MNTHKRKKMLRKKKQANINITKVEENIKHVKNALKDINEEKVKEEIKEETVINVVEEDDVLDDNTTEETVKPPKKKKSA